MLKFTPWPFPHGSPGQKQWRLDADSWFGMRKGRDSELAEYGAASERAHRNQCLQPGAKGRSKAKGKNPNSNTGCVFFFNLVEIAVI